MTSNRPASPAESELGWFRRRQWLTAAASWIALGGAAAAAAQTRSNVLERVGDVLRNGAPLGADEPVGVGDELQTGPGARLTAVVDGVALHLRANSRLRIEAAEGSRTLSMLRLITGAMGSAWSPGPVRRVYTSTLTAGIRGTGLYTEVFPDQEGRTYFCNCYGEIELEAGAERRLSRAAYHQSFWAEPAPRNGRHLIEAPAINHTDEEIEALAALVAQRTAWQISGRRGSKDGRGGEGYPVLNR